MRSRETAASLVALLVVLMSIAPGWAAPPTAPTLQSKAIAAEQRDGRVVLGLQVDYGLYQPHQLADIESANGASANPAASVESLVSWETLYDLRGERTAQTSLHKPGAWRETLRQQPTASRAAVAARLSTRFGIGDFDVVLTERSPDGNSVVPRPLPVRTTAAGLQVVQGEIPLSSLVYNAFSLVPELDPRGRSHLTSADNLGGLERFEVSLAPPQGGAEEAPLTVNWKPTGATSIEHDAARKLFVYADVDSDPRSGYGKTAAELATASPSIAQRVGRAVFGAQQATSIADLKQVWHRAEHSKLNRATAYFRSQGVSAVRAVELSSFVAARNPVDPDARLLATIDAGVGWISFWVNPSAPDGTPGTLVDVAMIRDAGSDRLADNFVVLGDHEGLTYQLFWSDAFKKALVERVERRTPQVLERIRSAATAE